MKDDETTMEGVPAEELKSAETTEEQGKEGQEGEKKDDIAHQKDMNDIMELLRGKTRLCEESRKKPEEKNHAFWDTQPVANFKEDITSMTVEESGPIDDVKTVAEVKKEPYPLPAAFEWHDCDMGAGEVDDIYALLSENYVEDDDNMFRFEYSKDFLGWALQPPGHLKEWHLGVRVKQTKKLVAFISAIPADLKVHRQTQMKVAEINFLCVHKKLRAKRLAPVLIKEITRRVNQRGIWQAVYTAGIVLPRPVAECRYYHRSLNPKKLIDVGFSYLAERMTMARTLKLYKLPEESQIPGFRKMVESDVPQVTELLKNFLKKFGCHPEFTKAEVKHWILPKDGVVYSYVRETSAAQRAEAVEQFGAEECSDDFFKKEGQKITDICSFYALPSTILGHAEHNKLNAAYSFWNVARTVTWPQLMMEALIGAKQNEFDVFNALDVMENQKFLKELKFGVGDGYLQYYLYNWKCPKLAPTDVGLVLL